ncbi:MAG: hypothetical protein ACRCZ2_10105, partial [Fusobacteriaceae bacterium]
MTPAQLAQLNQATADNTAQATAITALQTSQTTQDTAIVGKVTANTAIVGATKTKITYDAKGLVTAGADATGVDIIITPTGTQTGVN